MNRPNFEPIFSEKNEFCEKSSQIPIKSFVPHQSMTLSELMKRFDSGQRLNVHSSPMNTFYRSEDEANVNAETFDDAPPTDVYDIADVELHYAEHKQRVANFKEKQKQAQQAKAQPAQPADTAPVEGDPSK